MWWLYLLGFIFLSYSIFIVKYYHKMIYKDLGYLTRHFPYFKEEYKPFERLERKKWNIPLIYFGAIFLVPIRLLSLVYFISLLAMVSKLCGIKHVKQASEELPKWKRFFISKTLNLVGWGISFSMGYLHIKRIKKRIQDYEPTYPAEKYAKEKKGQNPPILVSNHVSWMDIMSLATVKEAPSFLSKDDIIKYPLFGVSAIGIQSIFLQRESTDQRNAVNEAIIHRGQQIKEGKNLPPILIFPEGTTSNGHFLLTFKKGAFESLLPLKMYAVNYKYTRFNPTLDYLDALQSTLLLAAQPYNEMEIYEFDTYFPDHLNLQKAEDWEIYANHIRNIYLKALNVESSHSGYRDVKEYIEKINQFKKEIRDDLKSGKQKKAS